MKNTKRALLLSAIAVVMSIAMLIGSTFAWFTDSASTAVNTIQSGTLKVALEMFDVEQNKWVDAEGKSLEWVTTDDVDNVLWEPNCTYELPLIRVRNDGNLALKYEISVIGVTGDSKLLEVIDFTASIDGAAEVALDTFTGHLDAFDESSEILIKGHMDKDAGNEYQDKKIENIAITVYATQYTYESDSFDNQYDKDAIFYDKLVTTDAELEAAIQDPDVKTIAISGNLTYNWGDVTDGATALKGITLVGYNGTADSITFKGLGADNDIPNVTLKNITVSDSTISATEKNWEYTYLEFNALTANNVVFKSGILLKGYSTLTNCSINSNANEYGVWILDGNATLKNCTFTGARGVKIHEQYATDGRDNNVKTVVIDGCVFNRLTEKPGVAIDSLNTQITIKNSTFINCKAGSQGLYIYETSNTVPTLENNTVVKPVDTAAELKDAIASGEPVILTNDITMSAGSYTVAAGTKAVIDLGGNDLTVTDTDGATPAFLKVEGDLTITGEGNVAVRQINASEGSKLTIGEGVTIEASGFSAINNGGTTVINGATINHDNTNANGNAIQNQNGGTLIINNAIVTSNSNKNVHTINNDSGTVTINGGTFTHDGNYGNLIHQGYDGEIIINGGTFIKNGNDSLARAEYGGKLTINAGEFKNNVGGVSGHVPATSTATTNADGSITVTKN